ncbi:MAG: hypothetical protein H6Q43_3624, partial [Deltaproteobacteria bacterium]|nr:hypothetical protein [Deltaproteobacteria bacterium]
MSLLPEKKKDLIETYKTHPTD